MTDSGQGTWKTNALEIQGLDIKRRNEKQKQQHLNRQGLTLNR